LVVTVMMLRGGMFAASRTTQAPGVKISWSTNDVTVAPANDCLPAFSAASLLRCGPCRSSPPQIQRERVQLSWWQREQDSQTADRSRAARCRLD
jgi:hypothetical protein